MTAGTDYVIRRGLRSPRSAATAGILYAILMTTGMVLTYNITRNVPADITKEWLDTWSNTAAVALTLVPFAGIAFLWSTGVVRDRLGAHEDQLFATIFLGSGIITVVLFFIWAAIFAALMSTTSLAAVGLADDGVYLFGFALMNRIVLVDHHHLRPGPGVPACRRLGKRSPIHIPGLGVCGEHLHSHSELPPRP